jgi:predicted fused transcriptional regulator/phosphomethylpyrimidine kinase
MTNSTVYWWQQTFDAAILETDLAKVPGRVVEALKAIEERLRSCIVYGSAEHVALTDARRSLASLSAKGR